MKITAYQRRQLDALVYLKSKRPSVWNVLMFRPQAWLPFAAIAGASFAFYHFLDPRWGLFMMGMTAGAILRVVAYARFAIKAWPITEEITDWTKVEALRRAEGG